MSDESKARVIYGSDGVGGYEEKGTASKPFRTDPTGSTTQPISATELPLPAGAATETTLGNIKSKTDNIPSDPAKESGKLTTIDSTLTSIKAKTDSIPADPAREGGNLATLAGKDFATQTTLASLLSAFNAEDFATQTTLATLATETKLEAVRLLLASLDGKDFATQTTLAALLSAFNAEDFASEAKLELVRTILASIKDTDGIKKITDALPVGDNLVGRVKITDGSTVVGVTPSARLMVDSRNAAKGLVHTRLVNGASEAMNVNGSVTPQVFIWNPGADDVEGMELVLVVEEPTISFGTTFFGITGLTNGLLIEGKAEDQTFTIGNPKYTRDFFHLAPPGGIDLYAASPDIMRTMIPLSGLVFKKSGTYPSADYVRITVRDNISGLNYLKAEFHGIKIEA